MAFDMNAGRKRKSAGTTTEEQIELRESLKQRNQVLDASSSASTIEEEQQEHPSEPTGLAAEKPCFVTLAIPESIKRIADMKVRYDSKELPAYNQTMKHVGRRWFLRGLMAEGLITQEQFDEASALDSEYGWERDKVAAKRRKS
ncbi:MAG: hypothetical protein IJV24_03250 [Prevotella sp.]|nr:hypothetical protein [Prevotella sp.]